MAVAGFGAVLAPIVVFGNVQWYSGIGRFEKDAAERETGDVFKNIGVLDGFGDGFSPGEGSMAGNEDSGDSDRIKAFGPETADDDCSRIADIGLGDFFGGEGFRYGHGAVKVVRMGGAETGDGAACLRPGGGEFGMGMDDTADLSELAVEGGVRVEVAGRAESAFDDFALEISNDEVGWGKRIVVDAAGFDDDQGLSAGTVHSRPFNAAGVAEGVGSEASSGDFLVGAEHLFAEFGQEHGKPSLTLSPMWCQGEVGDRRVEDWCMNPSGEAA